jgi:U6 snRNA-associated Sm-like protein LSm6
MTDMLATSSNPKIVVCKATSTTGTTNATTAATTTMDTAVSSTSSTTAHRSPSDFLKSVLGRPVRVKLNSGIEFRGIMVSLDGYLNLALEQCEEYDINDQLHAVYGDSFIRGNNGKVFVTVLTFPSQNEKTEIYSVHGEMLIRSNNKTDGVCIFFSCISWLYSCSFFSHS